ncbi:hypothetical protein GCM10023322_79740 [Rugosimonospora acidiphila]|uniref:Cupin domain-containing protein n=1 Tax=Rugosimonospora acidiphila TaxID=556531 RepID=A0ABP9STB6_9ACTN
MTTPTDAGWSDAAIREVRRLWADQLHPVDPGQPYPGLSPRTREFLTTVGLPVFEPTMGNGTILDLLSRPVSRNGTEYVVVGEGVGMDLRHAIEVGSDRVYFISPPGFDHLPEFENGNVALFVLFLGVFEKDLGDGLGSVEQGSDEAYEIIGRARDLLTSMDPEAMREGSLWESQLSEYEY